MLYENEYKPIMELYRLLRKEGVIFPERRPEDKNFIKFNGKVSPIFKTIEGNTIYEEPNKTLKLKKLKIHHKEIFENIKDVDQHEKKLYKIKNLTETDMENILETISLFKVIIGSSDNINDIDSYLMRRCY